MASPIWPPSSEAMGATSPPSPPQPLHVTKPGIRRAVGQAWSRDVTPVQDQPDALPSSDQLTSSPTVLVQTIQMQAPVARGARATILRSPSPQSVTLLSQSRSRSTSPVNVIRNAFNNFFRGGGSRASSSASMSICSSGPGSPEMIVRALSRMSMEVDTEEQLTSALLLEAQRRSSPRSPQHPLAPPPPGPPPPFPARYPPPPNPPPHFLMFWRRGPRMIGSLTHIFVNSNVDQSAGRIQNENDISGDEKVDDPILDHLPNPSPQDTPEAPYPPPPGPPPPFPARYPPPTEPPPQFTVERFYPSDLGTIREAMDDGVANEQDLQQETHDKQETGITAGGEEISVRSPPEVIGGNSDRRATPIPTAEDAPAVESQDGTSVTHEFIYSPPPGPPPPFPARYPPPPEPPPVSGIVVEERDHSGDEFRLQGSAEQHETEAEGNVALPPGLEPPGRTDSDDEVHDEGFRSSIGDHLDHSQGQDTVIPEPKFPPPPGPPPPFPARYPPPSTPPPHLVPPPPDLNEHDILDTIPEDHDDPLANSHLDTSHETIQPTVDGQISIPPGVESPPGGSGEFEGGETIGEESHPSIKVSSNVLEPQNTTVPEVEYPPPPGPPPPFPARYPPPPTPPPHISLPPPDLHDHSVLESIPEGHDISGVTHHIDALLDVPMSVPPEAELPIPSSGEREVGEHNEMCDSTIGPARVVEHLEQQNIVAPGAIYPPPPGPPPPFPARYPLPATPPPLSVLPELAQNNSNLSEAIVEDVTTVHTVNGSQHHGVAEPNDNRGGLDFEPTVRGLGEREGDERFGEMSNHTSIFDHDGILESEGRYLPPPGPPPPFPARYPPPPTPPPNLVHQPFLGDADIMPTIPENLDQPQPASIEEDPSSERDQPDDNVPSAPHLLAVNDAEPLPFTHDNPNTESQEAKDVSHKKYLPPPGPPPPFPARYPPPPDPPPPIPARYPPPPVPPPHIHYGSNDAPFADETEPMVRDTALSPFDQEGSTQAAESENHSMEGMIPNTLFGLGIPRMAVPAKCPPPPGQPPGRHAAGMSRTVSHSDGPEISSNLPFNSLNTDPCPLGFTPLNIQDDVKQHLPGIPTNGHVDARVNVHSINVTSPPAHGHAGVSVCSDKSTSVIEKASNHIGRTRVTDKKAVKQVNKGIVYEDNTVAVPNKASRKPRRNENALKAEQKARDSLKGGFKQMHLDLNEVSKHVGVEVPAAPTRRELLSLAHEFLRTLLSELERERTEKSNLEFQLREHENRSRSEEQLEVLEDATQVTSDVSRDVQDVVNGVQVPLISSEMQHR